MGTQPPCFFFQKETSSTMSSISFLFFLSVKIVLHSIFGSYGVFGIERSPSVCIFPSLTFFRSEISSRTGVRVSLAFLVSKNRFTWGLSHRGSFFKKKRLPQCLQYHSYSFCLLKLYCTAFSAAMEFLTLKNLLPSVFFLLCCFFVIKYRFGRAFGPV